MQVGWQDPPVVQQSSVSQDNAHLGAALLILLLLLLLCAAVQVVC